MLYLSKQERLFAFGTLGYALCCFGFVLLFPKGTEVTYISNHYSVELNRLFAYITKIAELPGIILFIVVLFFKDRKQLTHYTLIALLTALTISIFKHLIFASSDRPKVWAIEHQMQLPMNASDLLHFSFPSGHTAFAFCLMYCLVLLYQQTSWTLFFLTIGILVGLSRIYLLAHFVIDTGIGAVIGLSMGLIGNRLYNRYISAHI